MTHQYDSFSFIRIKKVFLRLNQSFKTVQSNLRFRLRKEQSYQIPMDQSEFSIRDRPWISESFSVFAIIEHLLHI